MVYIWRIRLCCGLYLVYTVMLWFIFGVYGYVVVYIWRIRLCCGLYLAYTVMLWFIQYPVVDYTPYIQRYVDTP
jgi:hypothetical protein